MNQNNTIIYTDGGCYNNGNRKGDGSYAFLVVDKKNNKYIDVYAQYIKDTTNNRMEMVAAIEGIKHIIPSDNCTIISDSIYLVRGFMDESYLEKWIKNGWITSSKKPVQNVDLWREINRLSWHMTLNFVHIRGHNKDTNRNHAFWNDICDKACTEMLKMRQLGFLFKLRYYFDTQKFRIISAKLMDK